VFSKFQLSKLTVIAGLTLAVVSFAPANKPISIKVSLAASSGSWPVYHHDNGHTGFDNTLANATGATTGWVSAVLDEQVYASPLVFNGVVYTGTLNNTVYALNQATGALIWQKHVGAPQTGGWICGNVAPMGILGTPVIDTAANRIYAVAEITGAPPTYHLFGLDLANSGNIVLDKDVTPASFDWKIQQQRGALALANGYVYVPFGGRAGDCFDTSVTPNTPYYGWVVGAATSGIGTPNVFRTTSTAESVWAAGGVVVDDATGNVFFATGNAIPCSGAVMSDAIVKVTPTLGSPTFFQPPDWQANWCNPDSDLGSASPVLISPTLMFTAGKRGGGFLLDPTNFGGVSNGQRYPARSPYTQAEVCLGIHADATFGSFAYAAPYVYVECETPTGGNGLVAINVNTSTPSFSPCPLGCPAPNWHAGGTTRFGPPIVAGGAVWAVANNGGLSAFDAASGAQVFQSASFGVNRFVTPAEAGGQVFVPSLNVIRSFTMSFANIWTSLGGTLTSGPDASSWASNHADVFISGADNAMWQNTWNGSTWSGWSSQGGYLTADPGAVSWGTNRIDVFVRGADNQMWHKFGFGAGQWSGWEPLGGVLTSGPEVASWGSGRLDVFVRGTDNGLWHKYWDGSRWIGWEPLGGVLTSDPTAVSWGPNRVDVFVRGTDNGLWHKAWDGSRWSGWGGLGGTLTSAPDAASCGTGRLDVFSLGAGSALMRLGFNGSWSSWGSVGGTWASEPGAVCLTGTSTVDLFERGTDNALWQASVPGS
jgi:hypothetical protein